MLDLQHGWQLAHWTKGAAPFSSVGQHLYINQSTQTTSNTVQSYLNDLRNVYTTFGGQPSSTQTHVTEVGWSTGYVSARVQARNLQTAFQTFQSTTYVGRGYWFRTQDLPIHSDYFGLVDNNNTHKPSFSAYQQCATY